MNKVSETLIKARDCASFSENDIREALSAATAIESIVLLDALQQAVALRRKLETLIEARGE